MYGKKYSTHYYRRSGNQTFIDIYEKNYSGSITTLIAPADCLQISLDGDVKNIYEATRGSGATIKLLVTPLTLTSFFTNDNQKYIVKVYSDYSGGNLIWQGFISTGLYQENYSTSALTPITLTCNDGMSLLDNISYKVSETGATYTGFVPVKDVMANIFSKLGITFTTIRTSNDLKIADYTTNEFLALTVNNENYLDESGVAMSCRKVLNAIFQFYGTMTFRGDIIYIKDPICLHVPANGKTFGTSPVYGYAETQQNLGGYVDVSGTTLNWYQTGQSLDVVQPFNQLEIKYNPFNFTEGSYDFNGTHINATGETVNNATTNAYTTITNDGTTYNLYLDVTMHDWQISGIYGFEGIQKLETGSTNSTGSTDYYIKQRPSVTGQYEYTFPFSNIKQDEDMKLELTMDFYINTKHATNLWSKADGTLVQEIKMPISIRIGNQWYGGGNSWTTTYQSTSLTLRTPDTRMIQTYKKEGWWLWKHTEMTNVDDSVINDTWTTGKMLINMRQSELENLINGSIHILIPNVLNLTSVIPWTAEANIKNVLIKDIKIQPVTSAGLTAIGNEGVSTIATLYNDNVMTKSKLSIELINGTGTYGSSKGAFSTDQQPIQGINIKGLMREGSSTYYDTAKLLAQNLISQYNVPRYKLTASLDVKNYLLTIEQKLIQDKHYLGSKAFYIASGTYYDADENLQCELIEVTSTRENII